MVDPKRLITSVRLSMSEEKKYTLHHMLHQVKVIKMAMFMAAIVGKDISIMSRKLTSIRFKHSEITPFSLEELSDIASLKEQVLCKIDSKFVSENFVTYFGHENHVNICSRQQTSSMRPNAFKPTGDPGAILGKDESLPNDEQLDFFQIFPNVECRIVRKELIPICPLQQPDPVSDSFKPATNLDIALDDRVGLPKNYHEKLLFNTNVLLRETDQVLRKIGQLFLATDFVNYQLKQQGIPPVTPQMAAWLFQETGVFGFLKEDTGKKR